MQPISKFLYHAHNANYVNTNHIDTIGVINSFRSPIIRNLHNNDYN